LWNHEFGFEAANILSKKATAMLSLQHSARRNDLDNGKASLIKQGRSAFK